jgi:uncharacterized integral membrane protein
MKPKTIVVLVLIGLFLIVLIQNTQVVTLRLLFWKVGMSQIILMPLIMLIGFILGYIVAKVTGGSHARKRIIAWSEHRRNRYKQDQFIPRSVQA